MILHPGIKRAIQASPPTFHDANALVACPCTGVGHYSVRRFQSARAICQFDSDGGQIHAVRSGRMATRSRPEASADLAGGRSRRHVPAATARIRGSFGAPPSLPSGAHYKLGFGESRCRCLDLAGSQRSRPVGALASRSLLRGMFPVVLHSDQLPCPYPLQLFDDCIAGMGRACLDDMRIWMIVVIGLQPDAAGIDDEPAVLEQMDAGHVRVTARMIAASAAPARVIISDSVAARSPCFSTVSRK